jgi:uncharacterized YccA/Bax inhibitor family protein
MRTSNPALSAKTFTGYAPANANTGVMTIDGTVNKSAILLLCAFLTATITWKLFHDGNPYTFTIMGTGAIGGFIVALVTAFKKEWSGVTAPIYALLKGCFLGGISVILEQMFPGIVIQAMGLTFGVFFCLLLAYKSGYIRASESFKKGVVAATGAIALVYLVSFVLSFFNMSVPYIHEAGLIGIGFSLFVVVIAALNLVLDFDFIEQGTQAQAPKYMEWYAAFGLLVTLIWLYIEILKLLAKLSSRRS